MENSEKRQAEILQERGKIYGNPMETFSTTGRAVTGLIEAHYGITLDHDIPAHVMAQIMVLIKAIRAVRPLPYVQDTYDDEMNYVRLAEQVDVRKQAK